VALTWADGVVWGAAPVCNWLGKRRRWLSRLRAQPRRDHRNCREQNEAREIPMLWGNPKSGLHSRKIRIAATFPGSANHLVPALGEHALGMELHALNGQMRCRKPMMTAPGVPLDSGVRRNLKLLRQRFLGNNQRVVTRASQRRWQACEDALASCSTALSAMHQVVRAHHFAPNARQSPDVPGKRQGSAPSRPCTNQRNQDAGLARRARPGDSKMRSGCKASTLHRQFVVAADHDLAPSSPRYWTRL